MLSVLKVSDYNVHTMLLKVKIIFQLIYVCTGDIIVHMRPQGFMKILACTAQRLNIWKSILPTAMFFPLRVLNPSKDFEHTVVKWKE